MCVWLWNIFDHPKEEIAMYLTIWYLKFTSPINPDSRCVRSIKEEALPTRDFSIPKVHTNTSY